MIRCIPFLLILFTLSILNACSVSERLVHEDGLGQLPVDFLRDIRKGETKEKWIIAQLGEPLLSRELQGQVEVHTWRLSKASYKRASLLFFLRYSTVEREQEYLHVVSLAGTIEDYWRDNYVEVQDRIIHKLSRSFSKKEKPALKKEDKVKEADEEQAIGIFNNMEAYTFMGEEVDAADAMARGSEESSSVMKKDGPEEKGLH